MLLEARCPPLHATRFYTPPIFEKHPLSRSRIVSLLFSLPIFPPYQFFFFLLPFVSYTFVPILSSSSTPFAQPVFVSRTRSMRNILPFHRKDAEANPEKHEHMHPHIHMEKRLKGFAFAPNWVRNEFIAWMGAYSFLSKRTQADSF